MSRTPISDRIDAIFSGGNTAPQNPVETIRAFVRQCEEENAASVAKALRTLEKRRKWDRERKQRAAVNSTGKPKRTPTILTLEKDSDSQVRKKEARMAEKPGDLFGHVVTVDDWPEDWVDQFWSKWPRSDRKVARKQVIARLERVRRRREATWAQVWGGLCAYLATNPDPAWMPMVLTWVNQARWEADYDVITSRSAKAAEPPSRGFGDVAFGRR